MLSAQLEELSQGITYPLKQLEMDFPMEKVSSQRGLKVALSEESRAIIDACYDVQFAVGMFSQVKKYATFYIKTNSKKLRVMKGFQDLHEKSMVEALVKERLPNCLKYLPMALSANNRRLVNINGRVGLWQLTYPVAIKYGLVVNEDIDERRDVKKASTAAASYIKDLYQLFKTHDKVLMAFCCGPAVVQRAIIRSNGKETYAELYDFLPEFSKDYILAYIVLLHLFESAEVEAFKIMKGEEAETVVLEKRVSMLPVSKLLGIKPSQLKAMNPIYRSDYIPASSVYPLHLPKGYKAKFEAQKDAIYKIQEELDKPKPDPVPVYTPPKPKPIPKAKIPKGAKKVTYIVKGGDNLSFISKQYKVKVNDLKGWNKLKSDRIDIGQKLTIYVNGHRPKGATQDIKAKPKTQPKVEAGWITYTVKSGDTLWSISKRHHCSSEDIMKWNNIDANIDVGQVLKIKKSK